jgi:hypothetical protein
MDMAILKMMRFLIKLKEAQIQKKVLIFPS